MSKKPRKVEEPSVNYAAKKPARRASASKSAAPEVKTVDNAAFKKISDKIFAERKELLHKLAQ